MRRMMTEKEIQTVESLRKDGILSLKDAQGNPRFVEGDITMEKIEGVTQTYGKWSLSGTHLMVVLVLDMASDSVFTNLQSIGSLTLPPYIASKIKPLFATRQVDIKIFSAYDDSWGEQSFRCSIYKTGNTLQILKLGNLTLTSNKKVRIQFDLLIDADYDE